MNDILEFLVRCCAFLWKDARFRIVDSQVTTVMGGDAWLLVASETLELRFVRDRGQLFLDLRPAGVAEKQWFSIDLVWRLLLDRKRDSAELDTAYAELLAEHLDELERRFAPAQWPQTRTELKGHERKRSKDLFG